MTQTLEPTVLLEHRARIVDYMQRVVLPPVTFPERMIAYHLGLADRDGTPQPPSPGKLIRPSLCLWAAVACGCDVESALPAAVAIELLHNFTLIHDDIQDGDRLRRDRETVWMVWGLNQGINAGDALYSLAFHVLSRKAANPERALRVVAQVTAAIVEVVDGQCRDLQLEGRIDATLREYLRLAFGKTGALLGASMEAGATLAGAPSRTVNLLRRAGRLFGVALQLRDDWLGIWGDPRLTGKSKESDLQRSKATYPVLAAYHAMDDESRGAFRALQGIDAVNPHARIRELLVTARGDQAAQRLAERYAAKASGIVAACGLESSSVERFEEMAQYIASRVR